MSDRKGKPMRGRRKADEGGGDVLGTVRALAVKFGGRNPSGGPLQIDIEDIVTEGIEAFLHVARKRTNGTAVGNCVAEVEKWFEQFTAGQKRHLSSLVVECVDKEAKGPT